MVRVVDCHTGVLGSNPDGPKYFPLGITSQLIEHLANTTSVAPPPAGPAGCRSLYLLHVLNLSLTIWSLLKPEWNTEMNGTQNGTEQEMEWNKEWKGTEGHC